MNSGNTEKQIFFKKSENMKSGNTEQQIIFKKKILTCL